MPFERSDVWSKILKIPYTPKPNYSPLYLWYTTYYTPTTRLQWRIAYFTALALGGSRAVNAICHWTRVVTITYQTVTLTLTHKQICTLQSWKNNSKFEHTLCKQPCSVYVIVIDFLVHSTTHTQHSPSGAYCVCIISCTKRSMTPISPIAMAL